MDKQSRKEKIAKYAPDKYPRLQIGLPGCSPIVLSIPNHFWKTQHKLTKQCATMYLSAKPSSNTGCVERYRPLLVRVLATGGGKVNTCKKRLCVY